MSVLLFKYLNYHGFQPWNIDLLEQEMCPVLDFGELIAHFLNNCTCLSGLHSLIENVEYCMNIR